MSQTIHSSGHSNPFSTRFVRPGAIAYHFATGETIAQLAQKLSRQNLRGAIVGPHGSGKSTLLATLLTELEYAGYSAARLSLHGSQRQLPAGWRRAAQKSVALLAVDGYEQLSRWSRWRLDRFCRRRKLGLLITAHAPTRLPLLYETAPSMAIAEKVAAKLLGDRLDDVYRARIATSFARFQGDIREVLFDLYDCYESRR